MVTPAAPTAEPITDCGIDGSLRLPTTEGVRYVVTTGDGREGAWVVEADPRLGYAIMPGAAPLCRGDLGARYRCPYIDVQFVSVGEYDDSLEQKHIGGYTRWGMGDDGSIQAHPFDDMEAAVAHLVDDSVHPG